MQLLFPECLDIDFEIFSKVYIRTDFAWYILDTPAETYRPFYTDFFVQQVIFHELITEARGDPRLTVAEFIEYLQNAGLPVTETDLAEEDIVSGTRCPPCLQLTSLFL